MQNIAKIFSLLGFLLVSTMAQAIHNKKMILFLEEPLQSSDIEVIIPGITNISTQYTVTPSLDPVKELKAGVTSFDLRWIIGIGISPTLEITIPQSGMVVLSLYDLEGTQLGEVVNGYIEQGVFQVQSDFKNLRAKLKSGMVLFVLNHNGKAVIQKLLPLYP